MKLFNKARGKINDMVNKIIKLTKLNGAVYIYVPTKDIEKKFLLDAEEEGFTFGNGIKPTTSPGNDLYRLEDGKKICHVGSVGHFAFKARDIHFNEECHYINYERYVQEMDNYDDVRLACNHNKSNKKHTIYVV